MNLNPAWISYHIHYKEWDEITYPSQTLNDTAFKLNHVSKIGPWTLLLYKNREVWGFQLYMNKDKTVVISSYLYNSSYTAQSDIFIFKGYPGCSHVTPTNMYMA